MQKRRRFKQVDPLDRRLLQRARRLRDEALAISDVSERERLLHLAREAEMACRLDQWLASPGLRLPT
jgi:hypothetical protein